MFPSLWTRPASPWFVLALALTGVAAVWLRVDLSPRVEGDFFFSEDDPQLQATLEISRRFPSRPQIVVRVSGTTADRGDYEARIQDLTQALAAVAGVHGVRSIATDDPARSPLFRRILLTPDENATNVVLQTDGTEPELLVPRLEAALDRFRVSGTDLVMSGVPVIVELIRRSLFRDLVVFSLSAFLVFAVLTGAVFRDAAVVAGTMATCILSVSVTLLLVHVLDVSIGLLTANLVTIVFVLTLSHVVFLTANWRRVADPELPPAVAVLRGVRETLEGSFWSMATTLLGFLSLWVASARPLRELGTAGAVGTVTAMVVVYGCYPVFLGCWATPAIAKTARPADPPGPSIRFGIKLGAGALLMAWLGAGVLRLDTDPGLLTYFDRGTDLRDGLEQVDADGGSSTLGIVVRVRDGARIDTRTAYDRMASLQDSLEADPAVGVVLSPVVLLQHARAQPLARLLSLSTLLDIAESEAFDRAALGFVTPERDQGLFTLRMRESAGTGPREEVIARVSGYASRAGLEAVLVGGLYDLQAQLGRLIRSSLRLGVGGLLLLFMGVAYAVARSPTTGALMVICLAAIPLVVLGTFGHAGVAVDIVTSPAASIALAMGVDSMIHLVVRARRLSRGGGSPASAWVTARWQIRGPVLAATAILCSGFGVFVLSSFPPTRRFGLAVMLGTVTAATMALVVLPGLQAVMDRRGSGA